MRVLRVRFASIVIVIDVIDFADILQCVNRRRGKYRGWDETEWWDIADRNALRNG